MPGRMPVRGIETIYWEQREAAMLSHLPEPAVWLRSKAYHADGQDISTVYFLATILSHIPKTNTRLVICLRCGTLCINISDKEHESA